ncbi:hypothetical protein DFH28DRAFT_1077890 [Melampsora americana]|nr:hypothetical protein DFH28DRAFT_1077890 [Melampsora americana]
MRLIAWRSRTRRVGRKKYLWQVFDVGSPLEEDLTIRKASNSPRPIPPTVEVSEEQILKAQNCVKEPLSSGLWQELGMNEYLDQYPGGSTMNLQVNSYENMQPQSGLVILCVVLAKYVTPINSKLVRSDEQHISGCLERLIDFEPDSSRLSRHYAGFFGLSASWISSFPSSLFSSIGPLPGSIWGSKGSLAWFSLITVSCHLSALQWVNICLYLGYGVDRWTRTGDLNWMLGKAQDMIESIISNTTHQIINSPINHSNGLLGLNQDGSLLNQINLISKDQLKKTYLKLLMSKTLCKLWRIQNVFIARGNEACDQMGPNGASDDPKSLSYCGPDNIIMNILHAEEKGNHHDPEIQNASYVKTIYGFTVDEITTISWNCQKKYNLFEFEPGLNNTTLDFQINSEETFSSEECNFNLPVCDCTIPGE